MQIFIVCSPYVSINELISSTDIKGEFLGKYLYEYY